MEFNQLEYLKTIAEEKTILKASEKLMISQPALTRSIQKLEDELGFSLFDRVKNRLVINETGELAVEYAASLLELREKMISSLQNLENTKKNIPIGSCAPAPLWGVVQILQTKYPKNMLPAEIDEDSGTLLERFEENAYRFLILDYPVNMKNITSKLLFEEQLYLAVKEEHELADRKSITFEELNGTTIMTVSNTGYWYELTRENLPDSLLLVQEDRVAYDALMQASTLAVFRSNLTIPHARLNEKRIYIPIEEAKLQFYGIFRKDDTELIEEITSSLESIRWENYNTQEVI